MRPRVRLKLATSLDGRIATATGESRWITGAPARRRAHELRAMHDAVVVGVETVIADDPALTVRLGDDFAKPGPARVVLDSSQRIPLDSVLVRTAAAAPTFVVSIVEPRAELISAGVRVIQVKSAGERPDLHHTLEELSALGITSVLVEGGGQVAASFLRCRMIDRIYWFRAPLVLGAESRPGIGPLALAKLSQAPKFQRSGIELLDPDLLEIYDTL